MFSPGLHSNLSSILLASVQAMHTVAITQCTVLLKYYCKNLIRYAHILSKVFAPHEYAVQLVTHVNRTDTK